MEEARLRRIQHGHDHGNHGQGGWRENPKQSMARGSRRSVRESKNFSKSYKGVSGPMSTDNKLLAKLKARGLVGSHKASQDRIDGEEMPLTPPGLAEVANL